MGLRDWVKRKFKKKKSPATTPRSSGGQLAGPTPKGASESWRNASTPSKKDFVGPQKPTTTGKGSGGSGGNRDFVGPPAPTVSQRANTDSIQSISIQELAGVKETSGQRQLRERALSVRRERDIDMQQKRSELSKLEKRKEEFKKMSVSPEIKRETATEIKELKRKLKPKDSVLDKKVKLKYVEPQFGTLTQELPKGYKEVEFEATRREVLKGPVLAAEDVAKATVMATEKVLETSKKGYEQMFFGGKGTERGGIGFRLKEYRGGIVDLEKQTKASKLLGLEKPVTTKFEGLTLPTKVDTRKKTTLAYVPGAIKEAGRVGLYAVPYFGQTLFGAEVGVLGGKVAREIKQAGYLTPETIKETIFLGGVLAAGGALKGISKAKAIRSKAVREAVKAEVKSIEGKPIKSLTIIEEEKGLIKAAGEVKVGKTTKRIEYIGRIMETESGKRFVPTGEGALTIAGEVAPKIGKKQLTRRKFISGVEFELGGKGTGVKLGEVGEVKIFEEIGVSTIVPKKEVFGITKIKKGKINTMQLEKQLAKERPLTTEIIKDIRLPTDQRNLLFQMDNIGLRVSKQEVGTVITIPKKKPDVSIGFKGKGQPSSKEFLDKLYAPQKVNIIKSKPKQKVDAPTIGEISARIKTKVTEAPILKTPSISESKWAGTGLYERMEVSDLSPVMLDTSLVQKNGVKVPMDMGVSERQFQPSIVGIESKIILSTKGKFKKRGGIKKAMKIDTFEKFKPVEDIKIEEKIGMGEKQKQATKQRLELLQKFKPLIDVVTPKVTTPNVPISSGDFIKIPIEKKKNISVGVKDSNGKFKVFVAKAGKDVEVTGVKTKKKAEELLYGILGKELRASGFIELGGRKVRLDVREGFRVGKRDPFRIVEKKQRRIKRKGKSKEAREIQMFRRRKGGFF